MDEATAKMVVIGIASVGGIVWLCSLTYLQRAKRKDPEEKSADRALLEDESPTQFYYRTHQMEGDPAELLGKAAELLIAAGDVRILEKTENSLTIEGVEPPMQARNQGRWLPYKGRLTFTSVGSDRSELEYALEMSTRPWLLGVGWLFQFLGLVALIGGGWALYTYVASSPNPNVRGQAIQMIQAVHFLWPPFLFAALYRGGRKAILERFDTFAHNLPYASK